MPRARVAVGDSGNSCMSAWGADASAFGCAFAQGGFSAQGIGVVASTLLDGYGWLGASRLWEVVLVGMRG